LVQATTDLLLEHPIDDVTHRLIAEVTGLNHGYITRHFGTQNGLFIAVASELQNRIIAQTLVEGGLRLSTLGQMQLPEAQLRLKLVLWLIDHGASREDFAADTALVVNLISAHLRLRPGLSEKAARIYAYRVLLGMQSLMLLSEMHGIDDELREELLLLGTREMERSLDTTRSLGW
jgi:AcrR family transcriptional regulator